MKANKRILLFSVSLLVPVAIIAPFVTSCGCSGNTGNFKDLVYGQQTPDITKDTNKIIIVSITYFDILLHNMIQAKLATKMEQSKNLTLIVNFLGIQSHVLITTEI